MKAVYTISRSMIRFSVLVLALYTLASCTKDYFLDENNLRVYVPQIQDGSIDNFYISFYNKNGEHVRTQAFDAPYSQYKTIQDGVLRFKMYPGETSITCFANYTSNSVTQGARLVDSYNTAVYNATTHIAMATDNDLRTFLSDFMVYPIGHPLSKSDTVVVDIDETHRLKGQVISKFIDLPGEITRIGMEYTGVATKLDFMGELSRFDALDRVQSYHDVLNPSARTGRDVQIADKLYPCVNNLVEKSRIAVRAPRMPEDLGLLITFFNGDQVMGTTSFSIRDLPLLAADKRPTDANGVPLDRLILKSNETIIFTFKGFTLLGIELQGWGDIDTPTDVTPM